MCGFVGYIDPKTGHSAEDMEGLVLSMAEAMAFRGPDDAGAWCDPQAGIALGHRRLSIIDLSPLGHQPMVSASGRYVIAYNGEVYNFAEIRAELERAGMSFRGHSDTEVILEAWAAWGAEHTLKRMVGMFALAVWDREQRVLTLARDRFGIKPLYWGRNRDVLFFGSQLSAFAAHPAWTPEIDRDALCAFVRHAYVPAPRSIFHGVRKLEPGTWVDIHADGRHEQHVFWDLRRIATDKIRHRAPMDDATAIERLDGLLRDAVKCRMVADVPLGAFLSGGVDSSTVVALMQAQSDRPIKTFSIGFHEKGYDEARHAKEVAAHLGTDHTELYIDQSDTLEVLPEIANWYDEPFADSSQVPTYLLSRMTREHVTVSLSGDGGDELFAGYNRYHFGRAVSNQFERIPRVMRKGFAHALKALSPTAWDHILGVLPQRMVPPQIGDKIYKFAEILPMKHEADLYRFLVSQWTDPEALVLNAREPESILDDESLRADIADFVERMQFLDEVTYLPDDILTKVDRASMAVSLEARVPLLDHRVAEFSWDLPQNLKIRGGVSKWVLRQVLYRYVPQNMIERPKMGFGAPIGHWLRTDLRDWVEDALDETKLRNEGYLNPTLVRAIWDEHLSGRRNWQYALWNLLIFQSWKQRWMA